METRKKMEERTEKGRGLKERRRGGEEGIREGGKRKGEEDKGGGGVEPGVTLSF